jgi:hypothetical protein
MNQSTRTQSRATANIETKDAIVGTDITKVDPVSEQGFYDFYLNEHQNIICRRLHFAGSSFGLLGLAKSVKTRSPKPLLKGIAAGYACAWVGHFFFEKNKPATFKYPLQSFVSDFRMYGDVLRGNLSLSDRKFDKVGRK